MGEHCAGDLHIEWLENFHLSKNTFDYLCTQLTPHLQYQDTHLQKAISVKKRVAITIWTLASSAEYRTVSHLFGIGQSTVCEVVHEICRAIVDHLLPKYIRFPSCDQQQQYIDSFEDKWGVPQCIGAIDGFIYRFHHLLCATLITITTKAGTQC